MPFRVNLIPRPVLPQYNEGSALRSRRDGDSVGRQWIKNEAVAGQLAWITDSVKRLQDHVNRLRLRKGGEEEAVAASTEQFYPFKVYQSPVIGTVATHETVAPATSLQLDTDDLTIGARIKRALDAEETLNISGTGIPADTVIEDISGDTAADPTLTISAETTDTVTSVTISLPDSEWRTFRVRSGKVLLAPTTGTDGMDYDDSATSGTLPEGVLDIVVPQSGEPLAWPDPYYVWLEVGLDENDVVTPELRYGDDPTAETYDAAGAGWNSKAPWTGFPDEYDGNHVMIAYIDVTTGLEDKVADIDQLLRTNIELPAEMMNLCDPATGEVTKCMVFAIKAFPEEE